MMPDEEMTTRVNAATTPANLANLARLGSPARLANPLRSKMARLRAVFDQVEVAFAGGASRQEVLDALNLDGLGMTMASFKSALQRIRRERREGGRHGEAHCAHCEALLHSQAQSLPDTQASQPMPPTADVLQSAKRARKTCFRRLRHSLISSREGFTRPRWK